MKRCVEYALIITVAVFHTVIVRADTKVRGLNRILFKAYTTQRFIELLDMVGKMCIRDRLEP